MSIPEIGFKEFVKGFFIFRMLWWLLKNLWWFFIILVIWKDLDAFMSNYSWWRVLNTSTGNYILLISDSLRKIPLFGTILSYLDRWLVEIKHNLIRALQ